MKQLDMFGQEEQTENKYTVKVNAPVYEPKNIKPHAIELYDDGKTKRLINEIKASGVPEDIQRFLIYAATRHTIFNYEKIADFYAHSDKVVQDLMERSALVIIDFEKAIQLGYVRLSEDIKSEYLTEYGDAE